MVNRYPLDVRQRDLADGVILPSFWLQTKPKQSWLASQWVLGIFVLILGLANPRLG